MPVVTLQDSRLKAVMTTSSNLLNADSPIAIDLVRTVTALDVLVNLNLIRLRIDPSGQFYNYRVAASDGRVWLQKITFPVGAEATMTFNVTDGWKVSEFVLHDPVRALIIIMKQSFDVTDIQIDFF